MKIKLAVLFGGKSVEHESSIITAVQAMEQIDKDKYENKRVTIVTLFIHFYTLISSTINLEVR